MGRGGISQTKRGKWDGWGPGPLNDCSFQGGGGGRGEGATLYPKIYNMKKYDNR